MSDLTNDFPSLDDGDAGIPEDVIKTVLAGMGYDHPPESDTPADPSEPSGPSRISDPKAPPAPDDDPAITSPEVHEPSLEPGLTPEPQDQPPEFPGQVEEEDGDDEVPPTPPGGPLWSEEEETPASAPTSSDQYTPQQVAQWLAASDPITRAGILQSLGYAPPALPTPAPAPAPTPAAALPPLPSLPSNLDFEDPSVQAMVAISAAQQRRIEELQSQFSQVEQSVQQRRVADAQEIINAATTSFQRTYNLPDEIMADISQTASRMIEPARQYMGGVDPRTGTRVTPDPYKATEVTFEMAYWNTPSARAFEIERQSTHRQKTSARKAKLGGVGGSSGSASRAPRPLHDETTREGREQAAIEFARQAMFGDDQ